jgi:hypothetical protein
VVLAGHRQGDIGESLRRHELHELVRPLAIRGPLGKRPAQRDAGAAAPVIGARVDHGYTACIPPEELQSDLRGRLAERRGARCVQASAIGLYGHFEHRPLRKVPGVPGHGVVDQAPLDILSVGVLNADKVVTGGGFQRRASVLGHDDRVDHRRIHLVTRPLHRGRPLRMHEVVLKITVPEDLPEVDEVSLGSGCAYQDEGQDRDEEDALDT